VNNIYLRTIAKGKYKFTDEQLSDIFSIANQCPDAGGPAVYSARSLYALVNDTIIYNDDSLCASNAREFLPENEQPDENNNDVIMYPNPANTEVTFEFNKPINTSYEIQIFNVLGAKTITQNVSTGSVSKEINVSDLPCGIYFVRIISIEGLLFNNKLVIQK
jgi:hypothetical protein